MNIKIELVRENGLKSFQIKGEFREDLPSGSNYLVTEYEINGIKINSHVIGKSDVSGSGIKSIDFYGTANEEPKITFEVNPSLLEPEIKNLLNINN